MHRITFSRRRESRKLKIRSSVKAHGYNGGSFQRRLGLSRSLACEVLDRGNIYYVNFNGRQGEVGNGALRVVLLITLTLAQAVIMRGFTGRDASANSS